MFNIVLNSIPNKLTNQTFKFEPPASCTSKIAKHFALAQLAIVQSLILVPFNLRTYSKFEGLETAKFEYSEFSTTSRIFN